MDPTNISEFLHSIKIEILRYRYAILGLFIVLSAAVLLAGFVMPKTYSSRVVLYADQTNIIGNLLEGKAEITNIDRSKEARDIIFTDRILRQVATKSGFDDPDSAISTLRSKTRISANGDYVNIQYSSSSRDQSFTIVDAVTEAFLAETARKKREESQSAFEFIDSQVTTYKIQLEAAEESLKQFSAQNIDVTESSVTSRVSSIKGDIQNLRLEIADSQSRLSSFEGQLVIEPEFLEVEVERSLSFEERQLEDYERQLSDLRLTYQDTHPDIVSLKDQVASLRVEVDQIRQNALQNKQVTRIENPAYTNLKEIINRERASLTAQRNRLANTENLLNEQLAGAETVAAKQATYKELTRDYSVTKDVYEDMLKRRESARLSMTLDIEGQGVTFKIHEPPSYPLVADGIKFEYFSLAGPVFGLSVPLGLIVLLVLLDKRVRSGSFMADNMPAHITMITEIPMYDSAITELASKRSLILMGLVFVLYMALYFTISFALPNWL